MLKFSKFLLASFLCVTVLCTYASAGTLSRLHLFEPGAVIYSSEVNEEFQQIIDAFSGVSTTKYLWVKNSSASEPACRFDQLSSGPIAEFKKNGTTKVSINNTGQIVSSIAGIISPFSVTSTVVNTNLNADLLDGLHADEIGGLETTVTAFSLPDGPGSPFGTITPTTTLVTYECLDGDGCEADIDETGVSSGRFLTIVCISTDTCGIQDIDGVVELDGDALSFFFQYDSVTLRYVIDRWIEISRSSNAE
ncbi:hypothetical protein L0244_19955 [bacterium]|nr:hypothetical protein [bacterium]